MRVRLALLVAIGGCLALPVAASAHPAPTNIMGITLGNATAALTHAPPDDGGADFVTSRNLKQLGFSERRVARTTSTASTPTSRSGATRPTRASSTASGSSTSTIRGARSEILNYEQCGSGAGGGQGDVVVWGSVLVRAWDVNAGGRPDVRRPGRPGRLRGHARLRHQRYAEPGARRQRRSGVRHAHADRGARSRQPPPAGLRHVVTLVRTPSRSATASTSSRCR